MMTQSNAKYYVAGFRRVPNCSGELDQTRNIIFLSTLEAFNLLKNQGYHIEHNFGHGTEGLSNSLLTLNLIAFAFHGACDQICTLWKKARDECSRRMRFFQTLDFLTEYLYFHNWRELLIMIAYPSQRPVAQRAPP